MTQMISAHNLRPFELSVPARRATAAKDTAVGTLDLIVVVGFCAIGLILSLTVLAQNPDLFAPLAQLSGVF
jgi:hypothetical protein